MSILTKLQNLCLTKLQNWCLTKLQIWCLPKLQTKLQNWIAIWVTSLKHQGSWKLWVTYTGMWRISLDTKHQHWIFTSIMVIISLCVSLCKSTSIVYQTWVPKVYNFRLSPLGNSCGHLNLSNLRCQGYKNWPWSLSFKRLKCKIKLLVRWCASQCQQMNKFWYMSEAFRYGKWISKSLSKRCKNIQNIFSCCQLPEVFWPL